MNATEKKNFITKHFQRYINLLTDSVLVFFNPAILWQYYAVLIKAFFAQKFYF